MASVPNIPHPDAQTIPQHSQDGASQRTGDHHPLASPIAAGGPVAGGDLKDDQTVRSLSQAAPEQLHQQHEPSVMGPQASVPRQSYLEPSTSERVQENFFLVATLVFAVVIWIMTLVAQAFVSARVSEEYVRTAWFALFLQLTLILLMAYLLFTTYLPPYHIQLSTLAALAIVFGVLAVDVNIRTPNSGSRRAMAASWFINVFIDLFWVFYFTSPPQALLVHAVHSIGGSRGVGKGEPGIEGGLHPRPNGMDQPLQLRPISGVSTMKSAHPSGSGLSPVPEASVGGGSRPGTLRKANSKRESQRQSTALDTQGSQRRSGWSFYGKEKQAAEASDVGPGPSSGPVAGPSQVPAPETGGAPPAPDPNNMLPRAEALFTYTAAKEDPAELSFKKGEILYVVDRSGKWWEARKPDGSSGIVPSNYLRMLP